MRATRILLGTVASAAFLLAPLTTSVIGVSVDAAFAKSGNGNGGNGNGNSGGNSGGNGAERGNSGGNGGGSGADHGNAGGNGGGNGKGSAKRLLLTEEPVPGEEVVEDDVVDEEEEVVNDDLEDDGHPGKSKGKGKGRGKLASELKGLNAVHANPNALANASANSRVGRIASYQEAAQLTLQEQAELDAIIAERDALVEGYDGRTAAEIEAEIAELDPNAVDYDDRLAELNGALADATTHETQVADLNDQASLAEAEADAAAEGEASAFYTMSDGRELSDEAVAYIRTRLGL